MHLENVVQHLLFKDLREDVCKIIDSYYSELPPENKQNEIDKVWRIALTRMDMRKYTMTEDKSKNQLILTPPEPSEEIRKIQERASEDNSYYNRFITLNLWGSAKFKHEKVDREYYASWAEALEEAKWVLAETKTMSANTVTSMYSGGFFFSTAYCIREYLNKIDRMDVKWLTDL